jgi:hypothetical protein
MLQVFFVFRPAVTSGCSPVRLRGADGDEKACRKGAGLRRTGTPTRVDAVIGEA